MGVRFSFPHAHAAMGVWEDKRLQNGRHGRRRWAAPTIANYPPFFLFLRFFL